MRHAQPQHVDTQPRHCALGPGWVIAVGLVIALAAYLVAMLPFLMTERLGSAASPNGHCVVYVQDGGGFLSLNPLVEPGQRIYLRRHGHLLPELLGTACNYGDLGSVPQCRIKWSGNAVVYVTLSSDEGGTDRLKYSVP